MRILTDNGSDFSKIDEEKYGIEVIPLTVIDEESNEYIIGRDLSLDEFYQSMDQNKVYKTSQVNTACFIEAFEKHIKNGEEVLYIGLSSQLSGTVENAKLAKNYLVDKYPDCKLHIIDSMSATAGQKMMVIKAKLLTDQGGTIEDVEKLIEKMQKNQVLLFSVGDLNYLYKGGRLSKTSSLLGTALGIIPILELDSTQGILGVKNIARGKNNFIKKFKEEINNKTNNSLNIDQDFIVINSSQNEKAKEAKNFLMEEYNIGEKQIKYSQLSGVIGSHTGHKVWGILFYVEPEPYEYIESNNN